MKWYVKTVSCLLFWCGTWAWAGGTDNADAFLWKISKNGETAGYLAGTMHSGKEDRLPAGFQTALDDSSELVLETLSVDQEYYVKHPETLSEFLGLIAAEKSLADQLGWEKAVRLQKLLAESPMTADSALLFEPGSRIALWFAALMTAYTGVPQEYRNEYGVDGLLFRRAENAGKKAYGLEDETETMKMLSVLSDEAAVAMIDFALDYREKVLADGKKLAEAYERGNAAALWQIYLDNDQGYLLMPENVRGEIKSFVDELLLAQRNRNWLPELNRRLAGGRPMVAVGALHLFGRQGLVQLLRKQGWTVEAVPQPEKAD